MSDIIYVDLDADQLSVNAGPDQIKVVYDIGPTGRRGSLWFSGDGAPSELTIPNYNELITNDMYLDSTTGTVYQYILLPSNTNDWVKSGQTVSGPIGPQGDTGPAGPPNSLAIGTVTTGAAGSSASASITGTAPEQVLNLTLPKGDAGGIVSPSLLPNGESIDDLTSGLYHAQYAGSIANGYPVEGFVGYLMVGSRSSSYRFQVAYSSLPASRGTAWVRIRKDSTTWHPWVLQHSTGAVGGGDLTGTGMPNGVVTAPPGTYYTDTAGTNGAWRWLKKSGTGNTGWEVISGDTGWRNVNSLFVSPTILTSANIQIRTRRTNNLVEVAIYTSGQSPTLTGSEEWGVMPDGFRTPSSTYTGRMAFVMQNAYTPETLNMSSLFTFREGGSLWFYNNGGQTRPSGRVSFTTNDAWPTTLPGTPT